jgi:hypothetical protein
MQLQVPRQSYLQTGAKRHNEGSVNLEEDYYICHINGSWYVESREGEIGPFLSLWEAEQYRDSQSNQSNSDHYGSCK